MNAFIYKHSVVFQDEGNTLNMNAGHSLPIAEFPPSHLMKPALQSLLSNTVVKPVSFPGHDGHPLS